MRVSVLPESEGSFVFFGDGLQEGRVGVFIPRSATRELLGWIFADAIIALADKESPNYIKPGAYDCKPARACLPHGAPFNRKEV